MIVMMELTRKAVENAKAHFEKIHLKEYDFTKLQNYKKIILLIDGQTWLFPYRGNTHLKNNEEEVEFYFPQKNTGENL